MKKGYTKISCIMCDNWYFFTDEKLKKHLVKYHGLEI